MVIHLGKSLWNINSQFDYLLFSLVEVTDKTEMADTSTQPAPPTKLTQVQDQVNDVKVILKDNINKVLERGEKLDDLIDKTDDLRATADSFQKTSTRVARKYWWKNVKMMIIIGVIVVIIIVLIGLFAGGVIPT